MLRPKVKHEANMSFSLCVREINNFFIGDWLRCIRECLAHDEDQTWVLSNLWSWCYDVTTNPIPRERMSPWNGWIGKEWHLKSNVGWDLNIDQTYEWNIRWVHNLPMQKINVFPNPWLVNFVNNIPFYQKLINKKHHELIIAHHHMRRQLLVCPSILP